MVKKLFILIFIAASTLYMCRCKKTEIPPVTYKGIVLYNVCGNVVIQSLGPKYLGEDNWADGNNEAQPVYNHVFKVSNACEFGMSSQGDTINFTIVPPKAQQCAQCLLYVATPSATYAIRVIK